MIKSTILSILRCCSIDNSDKLVDFPIQNGNLIFCTDKHKIALDLNNKRTFYNQIEELATDEDRKAILAPVTGSYYFVINTAVLWTYQNGWVQITTPPNKIVFIGTEMPQLGSASTLYVDKGKQNILVWDDSLKTYTTVADKTKSITISSIDELFK